MINEPCSEAKEFIEKIYKLDWFDTYAYSKDQHVTCNVAKCSMNDCELYEYCRKYSLNEYYEYILETYPDIFI